MFFLRQLRNLIPDYFPVCQIRALASCVQEDSSASLFPLTGSNSSITWSNSMQSVRTGSRFLSGGRRLVYKFFNGKNHRQIIYCGNSPVPVTYGMKGPAASSSIPVPHMVDEKDYERVIKGPPPGLPAHFWERVGTLVTTIE
jgi:hypothetical protein